MIKAKTAQHTPGPWVLGNNWLLEVWPQDQRHEKICRFFKAEDRQQQIANARLIAAAPDLLAAAKAVVKRGIVGSQTAAEEEALRVAIEKTEGK